MGSPGRARRRVWVDQMRPRSLLGGAVQARRGRKMVGRQSPTLPPGRPGSTIGREELNFRVRDGNGWDLFLMVTVQTCGQSAERAQHPRVEQAKRLSRKIEEDAGPTGWPPSTAAMVKPNGQLVLVSFTHRCASTSSLSTLWSSRTLQGELISRGASHLDAFSGYPVRTWLPGNAAGATTGTPEVRPPRSSRTRGSSSQLSNAHRR